MALRRLLSLIVLASSLVVGSAGAASAECGDSLPLDQAVGDAEQVFVGTVAGVADGGVTATVTVMAVWKGADLPEQIEVLGGLPGAEDPRRFMTGSTYLFMPSNRRAPFVADQCSQTRLYSGPALSFPPHLAGELGADTARPPLSEEASVPADRKFTLLLVAALGVLILAVGLSGIYVAAVTPGARKKGSGRRARRQERRLRKGQVQIRGASRRAPSGDRRRRAS